MVPVEILRKYLDAADVSDETIQAVAKLSRDETYEVDDIIFREDQTSEHLYIMTSGAVDVQYLLASGKRQTIDSLAPGDFLVWSAVVKPHTTEAIAICRAKSTLVAIEATGLRELCEKDARFGYRLVSQLARVIRRRLQAARRQLADDQ